jgi:diguanylate cyclase (GGDEF)-like protein
MALGPSQTIFLLVNDASIADGLVRACRSQGFTPIVCGSVPELGSRLGGAPRAPLLLHTAALPPEQSLSEVLDYCAWMAEHRMQTLVLASKDDLQTRLAARRAGCIGFHLLPISDSELGDILAPLTAGKQGSQERVLVVDDVKVEAMIAGQVLRKAGFEVQELCNELEIMETIRSFQPDLILMDLNMPNASGSELTAIIRDHADMLLTPIVFLSGEQDATAQREAMRLGADEFLSKPVNPQTLVATVRARIKRSSGIRRRFVPLDQTDEATGLMSRRGFVRRLEARLAGQAGEQQPPGPRDGLLFLCIDDIEQLLKDADADGERRLLGLLGTTIRAVLGSNDIAARFGQHSFTVLATGADADALLELAHRLQRQLRDRGAQVGSTQPRISLSIGVAQPAAGEDALTLIARCESTCLQARGDGPGRVRVFGSKTSTDASDRPSPSDARDPVGALGTPLRATDGPV